MPELGSPVSSRPAPGKKPEPPMSRNLGKDLMVQLDRKLVNEFGTNIVEVIGDIRRGAMLVEHLLALPLFNEGHPTGIVGALIQLVAQTSILLVGRLHQHMESRHQLIGLSFDCMELRNTDNLG